MKRILSIFLCTLMLFALAVPALAADTELPISGISKSESIKIEGGAIKEPAHGGYFAFSNVNMDHKKSVWVKATVNDKGATNFETLAIVMDDPKKGAVLGYLPLTTEGVDRVYKASITQESGNHDLYFVPLYGVGDDITIKEIWLSEDKYYHDTLSMQAPDDAIVDDYSDNLKAVDSMGRAVASYEEVGDVKTDGRHVGIMYWNWFPHVDSKVAAYVIPEVIKKNPEARSEYNHDAWDMNGKFYWSEPALGFYDGYDYFVYRRHAEMLALAGVDAIFFDYTNGHNTMIPRLNVVAEAFRDAKAAGVDIPRLSAYNSMGGSGSDSYRQMESLYFNCFIENDYSDIWFFWEGKPLLASNSTPKYGRAFVESNDYVKDEIFREVSDFFTYRYQGHRNQITANHIDSKGTEEWIWLENFPQILRNKDPETGRPEFVAVGCGINESTVWGVSRTGAFSDPYCKGRGFSEVFGEDYSENGAKMAYFFREQAALALDAAPEFVYINGWNEFTTVRNADHSGLKNAFIDTFDDENSRDFEPSKGFLKDDYYLLMTDFIRKYKGVRPVRVASGAKTIDINGDASQWEGVGPEFINATGSYEREGYTAPVAYTNTLVDASTNTNNFIKTAKVSFDAEKLYFTASADKEMKQGNNFMYLYINSDRNYATGFEGYDYVVNMDGIGVLSAFTGNGTETKKVSDVTYSIKDNRITLALLRSEIGENDKVDIEFKWTDSVEADVISWYAEGSVAPLGRFNYHYTEIPETTLTDAERAEIGKDAIVKAGASTMIADGGKMKVYEKDIRVTPFEANGTLYVPEAAFLNIMVDGRTKSVYNYKNNMIKIRHYEMNEDLTEVINSNFAYTTLDSLDAKVNGKAITLKAPIISANGLIYVPLTFIEDAYGYKVKNCGNGIYSVSKAGLSDEIVNAVSAHLN
ncbi:MAG: hypothetical protein IJD97_02755 [Clostridia bacterium]|nr:hypothetical protein [Clostridia bacterium]